MIRNQHLAIISLVLSLNTSGWLRNVMLGIGAISGGAAISELKPRRRNGLTEYQILELAINSATLQIEEYELKRRDNIAHLYKTWETDAAVIEQQIEQKKQQLTELDLLTNTELDTIETERNAHINNLNNQIDQLNSLLDEQLAEIDAREQESLARLNAEVTAKNLKLQEISKSDEQWLESELARLEGELTADKQSFLELHKLQIDKYSDRITFLEEELAAMQYTIRNYEAPVLPEGVTVDQIAARRTLEILYKLDCTCDYKGSWSDSGYIKVRLRPRTGGIKQVSKWLDRLMFELDLAEKPQAELVPGAVQLVLRPQSMVSMDASPVTRVDSPPTTIQLAEAVNSLNYSYLQDFTEPDIKHSINGLITQIEVDWFNWLWNFLEPRPVRNQKAIIYRIWGKKAGDGAGYLTARGRLGRIAQLLQIDLRRKGE